MKGVKTKQEAIAAIVHVGESLEDALIRVDREKKEECDLRDAVLKQLNRTNVRVAELLQERDRMMEV